MKNENLLTLINVYKSQGSNVVLSGLSLTLDKGQCLGNASKNGSGKTTLLKIV
ncbi:MAG: hypothetical protein LBF12_05815 [Christensenellaceae bacterium]|jgi:ABC-type multidrug transport system ATPase subunit|nr:hypothetical protein [Christensenellaceae bacterium]